MKPKQFKFKGAKGAKMTKGMKPAAARGEPKAKSMAHLYDEMAPKHKGSHKY